MNPAESLQAFETFKLAIEDYISRLPVDDRIIAREKQFQYAMEDENYSLACKYMSDSIELLISKINIKHCTD